MRKSHLQVQEKVGSKKSIVMITFVETGKTYQNFVTSIKRHLHRNNQSVS
jgi:hypothetical protein